MVVPYPEQHPTKPLPYIFDHNGGIAGHIWRCKGLIKLMYQRIEETEPFTRGHLSTEPSKN